MFALRLRQPFGGRAEPGIVGVELRAQCRLGRPRRLQLALRCCEGLGAALERILRSRRVPGCLVERRRGGAAPGGADAPTAEPEPVATRGDHHGPGMGERDVDGRGDVVDAHGGAEQAVEQCVDTRTSRAGVRANGVADRRTRLGRRPPAERDDGPGGVGAAKCLQGPPTGVGVVDHHRGQRFAEGSFHRRLPTRVDLDEIEQGAEHTLDVGETFGTGAGAGGVERHLEGLGPGGASRRFLGGVVAHRLAGLDGRRGGGEGSLRPLHLGDEWLLHSPGLVALGTESFGPLGARVTTGRELFEALANAAQVAGETFERGPHRAQLATNLRRGTGRLAAALVGADGLHHLGALVAEAFLVGEQRLRRRLDLGECQHHRVELVAESRRIGFEIGHHAGIEQLPLVAFERSTTFDEHCGESAGTLAELLDPHEPIADVARTACSELRLDRHHLGVEPGQRGLQLDLGRRTLETRRRQRLELGPQRGDLPTGHEGLHLGELGDQAAVPLGRLGLALERAQLPANLAQQVLHAQQVRLGGVEASLRLLLALAELEDAGGFLDDRPAFLGPGVEDGVDLALADDDVLLTPDAGVGEQLLDVEQAARHTVDRVLGVAAAEQHAGDGDLAQLHAEGAVGVVDHDAHLGSPERRAGGGAGEDDIVHLLAAHRLGRLGAEHPRNGVDHVGLARPVGADHHGDPGFEHHGGAVGERLEPLDVETFQEHSSCETTRSPGLSHRTTPRWPGFRNHRRPRRARPSRLSVGTPDTSGSLGRR
jgi:hypothetical protein